MAIPGRPFARMAQAQQDWRAANPGGFAQRLGGLLAGGNPLFDVGVGLLAASAPRPGGVGFGEALANAMQFASQRQQQALQSQIQREALLQRQRQQQALAQLPGILTGMTTVEDAPTTIAADDPMGITATIPGRREQVPTIQTPEGQQQLIGLLSQIDPSAVTQSILQRVMPQPTEPRQIGESPLGKLFADLEVAEQSGNVPAAQALSAAIQAELQQLGDDAPKFSDIRQVRNDVIRESQLFLDAQGAYERLRAVAEQESPAGDLSLIYSFFRLSDPGSRVTESEFETAGRAGSLPTRIQLAFNRVIAGDSLAPSQRKDFLEAAERQYRSYLRQQQRLIDDAREFAERHGLDPEDVVPGSVIPAEFSREIPRGQRVELGGGVTLEFLE